MGTSNKILVVSGHAADFVWRCGGTIAVHTSSGSEVHVVCLSSGARGESAALWRQHPKPSEAEVRDARLAESEAAAALLGATVEYLDFGDHPMLFGRQEVERLVGVIRRVRPDIVLTHEATDVLNPDHESAFSITRWAVRAATVPGVLPDSATIPIPQIFSFESDQSTLDGFRPSVYVDITPVIDRKKAAMEAVKCQYGDMGQRYMDRARFRASLIRSFTSVDVQFAEAFSALHPVCVSALRA